MVLEGFTANARQSKTKLISCLHTVSLAVCPVYHPSARPSLTVKLIHLVLDMTLKQIDQLTWRPSYKTLLSSSSWINSYNWAASAGSFTGKDLWKAT